MNKKNNFLRIEKILDRVSKRKEEEFFRKLKTDKVAAARSIGVSVKEIIEWSVYPMHEVYSDFY